MTEPKQQDTRIYDPPPQEPGIGFPLSEEEAYAQYKYLRWIGTEGRPVCPRCQSEDAYVFRTRRLYRCRACAKQYSVTSGTVFAGRKLSFLQIHAALDYCLEKDGGMDPNSLNAMELKRILGVEYKSAYVLLKKIDEILGKGEFLTAMPSERWKGYWQKHEGRTQ